MTRLTTPNSQSPKLGMTLLSTVIAVGIGLTIAPATLAHPSTARISSSPSVTWGTSIAQTPPRGYTPPPPVNRTSSGGTTGGVRGQCSRQSGLPLLALAPSNVEQTFATSRPTLAWFVPEETAYDLVFQLFQGDAAEPLYDVEMTSQPGVMSWTLPADAPELTTGETYRWRVILICNPNRPSLSVIDEAQFVVAVSPVTTATSNDSAIHVNQMVAAGFWYDALALTLSDPNGEQGRSLRLELLQDLAQMEESTNAHRAQNLRSMIDTERY
ncbi:DUF928 domain-containing protein [Leptolyngbya sp. FACHB-541]|uniref:DUF928 domain-containing protein n=1 Tax=Leptolyngbya sp. FACHB-541 TaxID=2692810 RepID=UPI0016886973|nr:DUF928 domain-containing protein [Leptolyngbya sp. FACHB-541]MBD1998776.1 DUF928 domain-containing protein [Leptolyngbya sp. FACHB-541]